MKRIFTFFFLIFNFHVQAQQFYTDAPCMGRPSNGSNFDWTTQTYTIYTISHGMQTVYSPFYNFSLNDLNTNQLSQYSNKDFLPSDGWVFIKKDFGNATIGTDFPYLILYNKYSGTLRVFFALGQLYGQNDAATVTLTYNNGSFRSALLGNYSPNTGMALDNFDNNVSPISLNNYYNNSVLYWYYADFAMNYDPCLCNYKSSLLFSVKFSSNSTLKFTLDGTAIQNLDNYGRNNGNGGTNFLNAATTTVSNLVSAATSFGNGISGYGDWMTLPDDKKNFYQNLGGSITNLGSMIGIAKFLLGLIDGSSSAPPRPLAFDINLKGSGLITTSSPYGSFALPVPGANNYGLDVNTLPYYDNALGVFNLLTTPVANLQGQEYITSGQGGRDGAFYEDDRYYNLWTPEIKYIINPNAGLSSDPQYINITACYIYKYADELNEKQTSNYPLDCFRQFQPYFEEQTYSCDYPDRNINHYLQYLRIKITAKIKTSDLSKDVLFTRQYEINQGALQTGNFSYSDILPPNNCNAYTPPATNSEIAAVCNNNSYKNKVIQYSRTIKENKEPQKDIIPNKWILSVTPNPTSAGLTTFNIKMPSASFLKLYLIDATGRIVTTILNNVTYPKTDFAVKYDLSNLPQGVYFVVLETKDGKTVEKIIHN